jgi:hypothetical protein
VCPLFRQGYAWHGAVREALMVTEVRQVPPAELDEDCAESWERLTDEPDVLGVEAALITAGGEPYWSIEVAVAEFVRQSRSRISSGSRWLLH